MFHVEQIEIKDNKKMEEKKEIEEGGELAEVLSEMGEEELIRMRHRLRKAGKERGRRRVQEEIRKREVERELK
jgi:hypothetical protein